MDDNHGEAGRRSSVSARPWKPCSYVDQMSSPARRDI